MAAAAPAEVARSHARFPLVDAARAFAALTIFAYHVWFVLGARGGGDLQPWLSQMNVGVPVFFVISGFLLYRPFAASRIAGEGAPALVPYGIRRALRIVPAYWVALPLVVLILGTGGEVFGSLLDAVRYFAFLQIYDPDTIIGGIGQAWTLCVEVTFYAALPLWALLARRVLPGGPLPRTVRWELLALLALAAASIAWKAAAADIIPPGDRRQQVAQIVLPAFADQFALGMGLAVLSAAVAAGARLPRPLAVLAARPWLCLALAAFCFLLLGLEADRVDRAFSDAFIVRHELKGLIGALILIPAVFGIALGGAVRRALAWRPLLWLGLVSYSFYLWHLVWIFKLEESQPEPGAGWLWRAGLAFAITLVVSWVSYRLIEAPGILLGRRWARRAAERRRAREPSAPAGT
jgi:peptidoglycan/LPS O-acetylase OafA/YrhL